MPKDMPEHNVKSCSSCISRMLFAGAVLTSKGKVRTAIVGLGSEVSIRKVKVKALALFCCFIGITPGTVAGATLHSYICSITYRTQMLQSTPKTSTSLAYRKEQGCPRAFCLFPSFQLYKSKPKQQTLKPRQVQLNWPAGLGRGEAWAMLAS